MKHSTVVSLKQLYFIWTLSQSKKKIPQFLIPDIRLALQALPPSCVAVEISIATQRKPVQVRAFYTVAVDGYHINSLILPCVLYISGK